MLARYKPTGPSSLSQSHDAARLERVEQANQQTNVTRGPGAAEAEAASSSSVLGGDDDSLPSGEDSGDSPLPDFLTLDELHQHRVKPGNLQLFSERLSDFVRFVQRVHDLARATYDHPATLQRRLERDLGELRALLAAVRDAVATVQRLRAQRAAVRKEKGQVTQMEMTPQVREMESIVAVYDKAMYARWENVRHTHKADALNALLNDVKGKQQAMENLCVLIQRKQAQLQGQSPCGGGAHGGDRERPPAGSPTAAGAGARRAGRSATPRGGERRRHEGGGGAAARPRGGAGGNKRHVTPGSARTVALRRRRHHERQARSPERE
ncbi:Uncharacterized protein GBIM_03010 [Gryllus bimaculatus]|nr:Uncharacterized protein GBIM_03010 [Gryllus bimaculatus]